MAVKRKVVTVNIFIPFMEVVLVTSVEIENPVFKNNIVYEVIIMRVRDLIYELEKVSQDANVRLGTSTSSLGLVYKVEDNENEVEIVAEDE